MKKTKKESSSEILCSLIAGMVKSIIIQPFDFLRIRIQTSNQKNIKILNLIYDFKTNEGLKVFLKGATTTITGVMVASVFHLTCYQSFLYRLKFRFFNEENIFHTKNLDILKIRLNKTDECYAACQTMKCDKYKTYRQHLILKLSLLSGIAGFFSGIILSVLTTPIDNVRIRIQSLQNVRHDQKNSYYFKSPSDCLKVLLRKKGLQGLYVAFPICALRESSASFIYFSSFECMKNSYKVKYNFHELPTYLMFIYGGISGMLNWMITLPIDCVKTKLISDTLNENNKFIGIIDCVRKTYSNFGIRGFFSGMSIVMVRACIVNGAVLSTFEKCRNRLIS